MGSLPSLPSSTHYTVNRETPLDTCRKDGGVGLGTTLRSNVSNLYRTKVLPTRLYPSRVKVTELHTPLDLYWRARTQRMEHGLRGPMTRLLPPS